jgi:predicted nucleic-acid-binding Zn-ribbon protein
MSIVDEQLAEAFVCPKCNHRGAKVERLAMSGTGFSRLLEIQAHRYIFAACPNCGYTEVFDLAVLEDRDDLGTLLEVLFSN